MLKELQEQLRLEVERMENKLIDSIKKALNEEAVFAKVAEDLSSVTVFLTKNKEEENRVYQTEYIFGLAIGEQGRKNKMFSSDTNVVLLANKKVIGIYSSPTTIDPELINYIFSLIEAFREQELNPAQPEVAPVPEAAPTQPEQPKEDIQPDNLF